MGERIGRLVLSRRAGERLRMSDPRNGLEIWVEIVEVCRDRVRLRVDAPVGVTVLREELLDEGQR